MTDADGPVRQRGAWGRSLSAAQLFVGSFLLLVGVGTVGFKALPGLYAGEPLSWLDALFTATSAICVTGLVVVDTATFFTGWGQAYVLLLIQLGGLGILTFSTLLLAALGRRLSLRQEDLARSAAGPAVGLDPLRLTRHVVGFTLGIEAVGAALLYVQWAPEMGMSGALWPAVFHSVSAFCNAGFSTFSDSLVGAQGDAGILVVVMALVTVGGIGFLVLEELMDRLRRHPERRPRLSVHTRLVLATTALLAVGGGVLFTAFEWGRTFSELDPLDRAVNGLFLSVTARTAGFNAIDYAEAAPSTNFLTVLLMSVGGSPGSTAGGIKTTTAALLVLLAWARLRGRDHVAVWGRTVPEGTIQRAVGLFVVAFGVVTAAIFVLTWSELAWAEAQGATVEAEFLALMFEAASAFNTVGLSMGVTPDLSVVGRWTAIGLMFVGRVGPLAFAAALSRRRDPTAFRYASEDVGLG
ncbi:TrkH family potassium uptake protein [Rubrivirga marina]|uniref:TrkH family potassium uptake protein n=1 Tax=Rubrivirga marina TaxID=1196024 RepID=UPI001C52D4CA|nr:TrkH family potassium uptake protein [Rubrivirga marina]